MNVLRTLGLSFLFGMLLLPSRARAQATVAVSFTGLRGEMGTARLALPLYALERTDRMTFYRKFQKDRLSLGDMETVTFTEDTLFRRFPQIDPGSIWQLLVWGDYSLYRSVAVPEESSFVLYHQGQATHLQERNFVRAFNRTAGPQQRAALRAKSRFGAPQLARATRRLNRRYGEQEAFVYTPFEISRWQLEAGMRLLLTSPFVLRTNREQDFGITYHLGLNRRVFNHLPHFWFHLGLDQHRYRGNNTQLVIRQPDYLRSFQYSEWQTALGLRVEAAPQWAVSPYVGAHTLFTLPTQTVYVQRADPDRPRPSDLPFRIEQQGQGVLSVGYGVAVGLRIQLSDFWSFHAQYQGQSAVRVVNFSAPEGSSQLALDGEVRWQEFRQALLQFHLQFAIR